MRTPWDEMKAEDGVGVAGVVALTVGVALIYVPVAFIVLGVLLIVAALRWAANR